MALLKYLEEKRITGLARKQGSGTVPAPHSLPYSLPSAVGRKVIYNFGLTHTFAINEVMAD